jgi:predicted metalloprotease with PDZ domain
MIIDSTKDDSPAMHAGLREGDELVSIGKLDATKSRLFVLTQEIA